MSALRPGLVEAISKLDVASSALYAKMHRATIDEGTTEEEATAWVAEVEAARDQVALAEAEAIACITSVTSSLQSVEVVTTLTLPRTLPGSPSRRGARASPVSYTHLTLPTICSV